MACKNPPSPQKSEFPDAINGAGTPLAVKGEDRGSAIKPSSVIVRRGRRSTELRREEVENILAAGVFTLEEQRWLNRFTTIHFEAAKLADPVQAIGRLMKLATDWLRTQGEVLSYIWVREAGEGKGDHVHILWSVPPTLSKEFARMERGWRKRMAAKACRGAFKSKPVGFNYRHGAYEIQHGQAYSEALRGVLGYMVKVPGRQPRRRLRCSVAALEANCGASAAG